MNQIPNYKFHTAQSECERSSLNPQTSSLSCDLDTFYCQGTWEHLKHLRSLDNFHFHGRILMQA